MNLKFDVCRLVRFFGLGVILTCAVWYTNALALPNDASSPINISADSVEIDEAQNTSTYHGRVEAQQGSMRLLADHVTVQHETSRQPQRIVAEGSPVRYRQQEQDGQEVKAEAKRMEYDLLKAEIVLVGDARLNRKNDSFSSDRIFYDRSKGVIKAGTSAQGHQRVRISIIPDAPPPKPTVIPATDDAINTSPNSKSTIKTSTSKSLTNKRSRRR